MVNTLDLIHIRTPKTSAFQSLILNIQIDESLRAGSCFDIKTADHKT